MISRRNYFSISVLMLVVLFMFQFTQTARDALNDYAANRFAEDVSTLPSREGAFRPEAASLEEWQSGGRGGVACVGGRDSAIGRTAYAWAEYTKRRILFFENVEDCASLAGDCMLVLDPAWVDWDRPSQIEALSALVEREADLVFCGLPDSGVIAQSPELRQLLGIRRVVAEQAELLGLKVMEGFLLGGAVEYRAGDDPNLLDKQDLEMEVPWYALGAGTAVYMQGVPKEEPGAEEAQEYGPAVIWSRSSGKGTVFAVNGSYMEDAAGIGLLSAFSAKASPYELYPVVNAQTLVVANYPGLSDENTQVMESLYSLTMRGMLRDLVWPDLGAVYEQNKLGVTYMMSPQYDYADAALPEEEVFTYFMRQINEQRGEAGLSAQNFSGTALEDKLAADQAFLEAHLPGYRFASLYAGDVEREELLTALDQAPMLDSVRTVVAGYEGGSDILGYLNGQVTLQRTVADGFHHTYMGDFRVRCLETALGYSSVLADIGQIVYPDDLEDPRWTQWVRSLGQSLKEDWRDFDYFDGVTAAQADARLRDFLAVDYETAREGDVITLSVAGGGENWFLLRTHDEEIRQIEGGSYQRLEEGAFLIQAREQTVRLTLQPAESLRFQFD